MIEWYYEGYHLIYQSIIFSKLFSFQRTVWISLTIELSFYGAISDPLYSLIWNCKISDGYSSCKNSSVVLRQNYGVYCYFYQNTYYSFLIKYFTAYNDKYYITYSKTPY